MPPNDKTLHRQTMNVVTIFIISTGEVGERQDVPRSATIFILTFIYDFFMFASIYSCFFYVILTTPTHLGALPLIHSYSYNIHVIFVGLIM